MASTLRFRNLTVDPSAPCELWGLEGVLTAIDRGTLSDWRRLNAAVRVDPWGEVASWILEAARSASDTGAATLLVNAVAVARDDLDRLDRQVVAEELRSLLRQSGLSSHDFAARLGTSRTRLSSYLNARVCPSAAVMVRARRVVGWDRPSLRLRSTNTQLPG